MTDRGENAFTQYVRTLGRGKSSSRHLTRDEARHAMGLVLDGQVEPEQLGAFLMLLRVKEESAEEVAGFCLAARERLPSLPQHRVDFDWSCYAGKKRQPPWLVLAQRLLQDMGYRQTVHGTRGHTAGRLYVQDTYTALGMPVFEHPEQLAGLDPDRLGFVTLDALSPGLERIIQLRPLMGLRSPVHSFVRLLNPFDARTVLQGIFHTGYRAIHQEAGQQLGYQNVMVIKGEGGEFEVKPNARTELSWVREGALGESVLGRTLNTRPAPCETLEPGLIRAVWEGTQEDAVGRLATISTVTVALMAHEALDEATARERAESAWENRRTSW